MPNAAFELPVRATLPHFIAQLPFELSRPGASGRERTYRWSSSIPCQPSADALTPATVIAALAALLHRYTQQHELAIDLCARTGREPITQLSFALASDTQFSELSERAAAQLSGQKTGKGASNVGLTISVEGAEAAEAALQAHHDLHFVVRFGGHGATLQVAYDAGLFSAASSEEMGAVLAALIAAGCSDPNFSVAAFSLLGVAEARAIHAATASAQVAPPDEPMFRSFERFARERPNALAVRFEDQQLSYAELDARASQLARHLAALGVRGDSAVAVCLKPSVEVLVAILAIFKVGGVYLPLDPSYPRALLETILDEVKPLLALSDASHAGAALPSQLPVFRFDVDWELTAAAPALPSYLGASIEHVSHILYTSGTTGKPKGVVASQRNLAFYLRAARERYGFTSDDVFCSLARYTFSISLFELLSPLACGASLNILSRDEVLDPSRLTRALAEVSVVHAGPSLLSNLLRHLSGRTHGQSRFAKLRHLSTGGDLVPPQLLEQLKSVFRESELFVIYGCTEVSCMGATFEVPRDQPVSRCLVGKAFPGVSLRVLDARGSAVPFGVVGEIFFAGFGVTKRYLDRPELTSERFVAIDGQRFYRTGDLGRIQRDGNLEILGRSDFQVQVRGIRVELPGIEHTIRELGLAQQCAVVACNHGEQDVRLAAFLVGAADTRASSCRSALAKVLPDYMLPQKIIALEALPLTANGKLDRRQLVELARDSARPERQPESSAPQAQPESALEQEIAASFASVLGLGSVSIDESFFDMGGHSLLAVMLMEELHSRLGIALSPAIVFEHSSVRALAREAESCSGAAERPILLSESAAHPKVFALLGVFLYRELARALEGRFSLYGVFAGLELSLLGASAEGPSVVELARTYLALIRAEQPSGPYRLIGMSFGGIVAYEVAQQLLALGEEVELLGMLDAVLPESPLSKMQRLLLLPGRSLVSELSERVYSRLQVVERPQASLFVRATGDARLDQLEESRQHAYRLAARDYLRTVRPYAHEAVLVVAGERLKRSRLQNPRCGWDALVPALSVHTVASDHLGVLEAPSVGKVAEFLAQSVQRASDRPLAERVA